MAQEKKNKSKTLKDILDINKDGEINVKDIKDATKAMPKWKVVVYTIVVGIFLLITNWGPTIFEILFKG